MLANNIHGELTDLEQQLVNRVQQEVEQQMIEVDRLPGCENIDVIQQGLRLDDLPSLFFGLEQLQDVTGVSWMIGQRVTEWKGEFEALKAARSRL